MTGSFSPTPPSPGLDSFEIPASVTSLPLATQLREFELTGVLGEGGFSFVYTAWDHSLERTVAIKEYMPGALAARLPDGSVVPKSPKHEDTFRAGLASFINEAGLLSQFKHPALVQVYGVWEQNGTAYMAMQYCVGKTLRQISSDPAIVKDEQWLKTLFAPILDALELLHAQNCLHRDISPDNILVLQGAGPVLLDFGAARQVIGDMTQALTVILRPGFAPIEQYADDPNLRQGPWTDVYGVGAILYYMLMGKPPVASVARLIKDPIPKLADADELAGISRSFREAIDHALAVYPNQRIQSIAELSNALQLPAYNRDAQIENSLNASAEVPQGRLGEVPFSGRTDADAAAITFRRPSRQPNIVAFVALGIGLVVAAALAMAVNSMYKPAQRTRVVVNKVIPAANTPKASPTADSATLPPVNTPAASAAAVPPIAADQASASQATSVSALPSAAMAAAASHDARVQSPAPDMEAPPPIREKSDQAPPSPDKVVAALKKTPPAASVVSPTSSPHTSPSPVMTSNANSSSSAATPTAKTRRQIINGVSTSAPTATVFQPTVLPNKTSLVRLSIKPWGQVTVDGRPQGVSPPLTRLSLTPGNHVVVITNSDFPPATIPITVSEKEDIVVSHRFGRKP